MLIIIIYRTETQAGTTALGVTGLDQIKKEMEQYETAYGVIRPTTLEDPSLVIYRQSNSNILREILLQYIVATVQGIKINLDYIYNSGTSRKYK